MDVQNNCESDTSESWSLVDINEKDQAFGSSLTDSFHPSATVIQDKNINVVAIASSVTKEKNCDQLEEDGFQCSSNLKVDSVPSTELSQDEDFQVLYKGKVFEDDYDLEKKPSDDHCDKTTFSEAQKPEIEVKVKDSENETDSISVISESECNDFKISAYETDEIWEEKLSGISSTTKLQPNVLKRKRKRLKLNYRESSDESVSSDFMFPDGKYCSNVQSADLKKNNNEVQMKEYPSTLVYRHNRNNVTKTVLGLAMGVIFVWVACIALDHFLGAHDAHHTAGEMMETLKRLQMENILLQTRLAQLSRAFFSRSNNKLEIKTSDEPHTSIDKIFDIKQNIENNKVPEVKSSLFVPTSTVSFMNGIGNPVVRSDEGNIRNWDKSKLIRQFYHDEKSMNDLKHDQLKCDVRKMTFMPVTFKEPQKMERFPFQKTAQGVSLRHKRQLKDLNVSSEFSPDKKNLDNLNAEASFRKDVSKQQECLAIRERDLNSFPWLQDRKRRKRKSYAVRGNQEGNASAVLFKFPQPESFYLSRKKQSFVVDSKPEGAKWKSIPLTFLGAENRNVTRVKKERKELGMKNRDGKVRKRKKEEKGRKKEKLENEEEKVSQRKHRKRSEGVGRKRSDDKRRVFKRGGPERREVKLRKVHPKRGKEKAFKKFRELTRRFPCWCRKRNLFRSKKSKHFYQGLRCNATECMDPNGYWQDNRSKAREINRREQKVTDWLFYRAKSREKLRSGDGLWQFDRAMAREKSRN